MSLSAELSPKKSKPIRTAVYQNKAVSKAGISERLFALVRQLRSEGIALIYISHRMAEVYELSDRVSVLRDGSPASTLRFHSWCGCGRVNFKAVEISRRYGRSRRPPRGR